MHGILWLASYPKSGNTWSRAFLHNLFTLLEGKDVAYDINEINEFTTWDISAARYAELMGEPPSESNKESIASARPKVQAAIAEAVEGLAIVKTHHALVSDRGHPTINFKVTSGAVYVVRCPLDIAVSFSHHTGAEIDKVIEDMSRKDYETPVTEKSVYEVYSSWSRHVESWTRRPHRAVHVVRYEDMLEDPAKTFGELARHLQLRPTKTQLETAIARSSFEKLREQEDLHGFREKPPGAQRFFREGRSGQWQEHLSRRQVRRLVSAHAVQMRRFGYLTPELEHLAG